MKIKSCLEMEKNIFLVEIAKKHEESFPTLLMKGLNATFQKEYHESNIDPKKFPFLAYNIFFKSPDFLIFKTHMTILGQVLKTN